MTVASNGRSRASRRAKGNRVGTAAREEHGPDQAPAAAEGDPEGPRSLPGSTDDNDEEPRLPWSPTSWQSVGVVAIAAAGLVAVIVATIVGGLAGANAPTADVAAETDVPVGLAATGGEPAGAGFEATFDALPMDSTLPPPWVVEGGDGASVVALPTSVDRSIRIRSSGEGEPTSACREAAIPEGAGAQIRLDMLVGGRPPEAVPAVTLVGAGETLLSIGIDPTGAIVALPAEGGGERPSGDAGDAGWRRIEAVLDPEAGTLTWAARDTSGTEVASGSAAVSQGASLVELCLSSPQGTPSGWIAVDDLVVRG